MPGSNGWQAKRLRELTDAQHGLIGRRQALDLGISAATLGRRARAEAWDRRMEKVFAVTDSGDPWMQRLMSATLAIPSGAAACRRSAAALHRLSGFSRQELEVVCTRRYSVHLSGVVVHRTLFLPHDHVTNVFGIPATTVARTILDLGGTTDPKSLERAVEDGLGRQLVTVSLLAEMLGEAGAMGRPGTAALRRLLDLRDPEIAPTDSWLEDSCLALLSDKGYPKPARQREALDRDVYLARIDLAYPRRLIGIEADGFAFHSARPDFVRDRRRQNELASRGWIILRFTEEDVNHPYAFLSCLRRAFGLTENGAGRQTPT